MFKSPFLLLLEGGRMKVGGERNNCYIYLNLIGEKNALR